MIKIEAKELKDELNRLKQGIENFEPYTKEFITDTIDSFQGFNSDFIDEIKKTLGNMTDTKAPKLLKKVQEFHDGALKVVLEFERKDVGLSKQINFKK